MPPQRINEKHKKVKLIIFDLDGTLALSKAVIDSEMASLLRQLLAKKLIAVIGGGEFGQFKKQLLDKLSVQNTLLKNLFLFPTNAASFYRHTGRIWQREYIEKLSNNEKTKIFDAFKKTFEELGYHHPKKIYGKLIEDRDTQITFSALGQLAPLRLKNKWDVEHVADKFRIAKRLQEHLPEFEVKTAGYTSIDVTRKGIDKGYGVRQIKKRLDISFGDMIFVGDAIFPGGNDYEVLRTGVECFKVKDVEDTKKIIKNLLKEKVQKS